MAPHPNRNRPIQQRRVGKKIEFLLLYIAFLQRMVSLAFPLCSGLAVIKESSGTRRWKTPSNRSPRVPSFIPSMSSCAKAVFEISRSLLASVETGSGYFHPSPF